MDLQRLIVASQFIIWVGLCFVVAWLLQRKPLHALALALALWFAVPSIAGHHITGSSSGTTGSHPADWLVLSILVVQLLLNRGPLLSALGRHFPTFMIISVFLVTAVATSALLASGGIRLFFDQLLTPALAFWLILAYADRLNLIMLRNVVIGLVAAESALAIVQWQLGRAIFWEQDFAERYWFDPATFDRWLGTTDTPLVMSLVITVAAALTVGLRNSWLRLGLLTLFVIASVITQSRTGAAFVALIVVWTVIRARTALWARVASLLVIAVGVAALLQSAVVSGLFDRIGNDTGSTDARIRAVQFVVGRVNDFLFVGNGLTSSYDLGRTGGLNTSIESSYLMYAVDVGLLFATAYFGLQFVLLVRNRHQRAVPGAVLGAVVGLLLQHTFSGIAGSNVVGMLLWVMLGLVVAGARVTRELGYARSHAEIDTGAIDTGAIEPPAVTAGRPRDRQLVAGA